VTALRSRASIGPWPGRPSQTERKKRTSPLAQTVEPPSQQLRDEDRRIDGQLEGGGEQVGLAAEVVVDECRIDAGLAGHAADGGAPVAGRAEAAAGRVEDRLAGTAVAGASSGTGH
jgi:hypothetical protein